MMHNTVFLLLIDSFFLFYSLIAHFSGFSVILLRENVEIMGEKMEKGIRTQERIIF